MHLKSAKFSAPFQSAQDLKYEIIRIALWVQVPKTKHFEVLTLHLDGDKFSSSGAEILTLWEGAKNLSLLRCCPYCAPEVRLLVLQLFLEWNFSKIIGTEHAGMNRVQQSGKTNWRSWSDHFKLLHSECCLTTLNACNPRSYILRSN